MRNVYQTALDIQDTYNLLDVVHAFDTVITEIWKEAQEQGKGPTYIHKHPVTRLFTGKIASLVCPAMDLASYATAYHTCVEHAKGSAEVTESWETLII
jgi:hypothetical protein